MKVTVEQLIEANNKNLGELQKLKDIPARTAFGIAILLKEVREPIITAMKTQAELMKKYNAKIVEGAIVIVPEKREAFNKEWNDFLKTEIDLNIEKIKFPNDIRLPDSGIFIGLELFIEIE